MKVNRTTQCMAILAHLKAGRAITHYDAERRYGCTRLAARVSDLKQAGWRIESKMVQVYNRDGEKCRVAEYRLIGREKKESVEVQEEMAI